uniref:peptidylglycine monooxygenase n=1 Tax=Panagrolaimus davidi TaxID=227884 RepID=A0A914PHJ3_9BILA
MGPSDADYVNVAINAPPGYIIKFETFASGDRVHHMSLFGCTLPAYNISFWKGHATCSGLSHILYAWARNAPSFQLPKDIAFSIGNEGDQIHYLVLQIHYAHAFEGNVKDFSGIKLHLSKNRPKYIAQVYDLDSNEKIPPGLNAAYINMSCYYHGKSTLHPIAFLSHTHGMGRLMSAFVKHSSNNQWEMIGKRNPQWPQLFQKIEKPLEIKNGDFIAAMCRFDSSNKTKFISMGHKADDEMCNFYIMFYRLADEPDSFPNGTYCDGNENPMIVKNEYPEKGTIMLPFHPEWEHSAHQRTKPFGILEKMKLKNLGKHAFGQISSIAFDSKGNIIIFHRGIKVSNTNLFDKNNILFDRSPISEAAIIVAKDNGDDMEFVEAVGENL